MFNCICQINYWSLGLRLMLCCDFFNASVSGCREYHLRGWASTCSVGTLMLAKTLACFCTVSRVVLTVAILVLWRLILIRATNWGAGRQQWRCRHREQRRVEDTPQHQAGTPWGCHSGPSSPACALLHERDFSRPHYWHCHHHTQRAPAPPLCHKHARGFTGIGWWPLAQEEAQKAATVSTLVFLSFLLPPKHIREI